MTGSRSKDKLMSPLSLCHLYFFHYIKSTLTTVVRIIWRHNYVSKVASGWDLFSFSPNPRLSILLGMWSTRNPCSLKNRCRDSQDQGSPHHKGHLSDFLTKISQGQVESQIFSPNLPRTGWVTHHPEVQSKGLQQVNSFLSLKFHLKACGTLPHCCNKSTYFNIEIIFYHLCT